MNSQSNSSFWLGVSTMSNPNISKKITQTGIWKALIWPRQFLSTEGVMILNYWFLVVAPRLTRSSQLRENLSWPWRCRGSDLPTHVAEVKAIELPKILLRLPLMRQITTNLRHWIKLIQSQSHQTRAHVGKALWHLDGNGQRYLVRSYVSILAFVISSVK